MSRKSIVFVLALLVAALTVAGCAPAAPAPVPVPATKTPKPTFTPSAVPTEIPFATAQPIQATSEAVATKAAVPTAEPTVEPTAAPTAMPEATKLTAGQTVNVRSGPGTAYPAIGRLTAGQSYDVTGRNTAGDWLKFDYNGKDGWVTASLVTVEGDVEVVQVAQAPALPTARPQPTARPRPVQPTNPPPPPAPTSPPAPQFPYSYMEGSANCQPNAGTTYFNGFVRDRSNNLLNGVCVHIAFFGPRQTKCSGCGGVGNGVWGFAPFGSNQPGPGTTIELYVTSCEGVGPTGDLSTFSGPPVPQSNKFVRTLNQGEQCTGITFLKN